MIDELAIADRSYIDWWTLWASSVDGGEVREDDGVVIINAAAPQEWWNCAFISRRLVHPEDRIHAADSYFNRCGLRYIWRVRGGLDESAEHALEDLGFPYTDSLPGMVLSPLPEPPPPPDGFAIREVQSDHDLEDAAAIIAESYAMDLDLARRLVPRRLVEEHPRWHTYVGYAGTQAVATASLCVTDDIAGVTFVATREAYRRHGYGAAVTWEVIRQGRAAGCTVATLQASQMGQPVYEDMGFRTVCQYKTFVRPDLRS